jgi:error-prone DNA polymerase
LEHGAQVRVGGLVVARQRPGTAKGITFLLLEDEHGTVNVIVSPQIYERERLTVRTEPLVVIDGRLERHASAGGAINIVARGVTRLEVGDRVAAQVKDFSLLDAIELARQAVMQEFAVAAQSGSGGAGDGLEELAATGTDDFRAVAPPVMNFGAGRSR